ncbi:MULTISPECIES: SCP2 domain-containing protein [unclassified Vibrio]|uniref:Ubiquinone biosynthesis accessory factor UbiJ n=1 Tax=Vibrio sp. HB236076 TaxID=3232307 RepID=A0AB39HEZ0_9VIBR|nr:SCP2 domain-containing protein [Vibrio sp. HB161653]MDP5255188.1 SCP2 domain-containing protein [Vibrio sp. HB161653]
MPFDALVTGLVEVSLNRFIQDDSELSRRLGRLKGQAIQIHLIELDKSITFLFSQQIDVLAHYEGEVDCYLSLSLSVLPQLKDHANITQLIKQDKLILEGDVQLAQKFANLLNDSRPDLAEWLSRYLGDIAAHQLVSSGEQGLQRLKHQADRQQRYIGQVLTEEWRVAPPALEIAYFCDQVDDLRSSAARFEARLQRIMEKL